MVKEVKKKRKKYKKRKVKKEPKKRVYCKHNYQIILTTNGKQKEVLGTYPSELKVNKAFMQFIEENKKVNFPVEMLSMDNDRKLIDANYEIVIIKKREEKDSNVTLIRNEFGDLIEYTTTHKDWVVYDKHPYKREESFWVYGYHPLVQRKDFSFIYNEIVKPKASNKNTFINVMLFKNKVLIETTNTLDMIICKNKSDGIRLYNLLEEWCNKEKGVKYYLFNGDWGVTTDKKRKCVEKIRELTNWDDLKINRSTTKP